MGLVQLQIGWVLQEGIFFYKVVSLASKQSLLGILLVCLQEKKNPGIFFTKAEVLIL